MRFSKMIKVTSSMLISHFGWESTLFVHMPMVAMQSIIRAERHQTMHQCHFRPELLHRSKVSRCVALASTIWELNKVRAVAVRSTSRIQCTCQHFNVARQHCRCDEEINYMVVSVDWMIYIYIHWIFIVLILLISLILVWVGGHGQNIRIGVAQLHWTHFVAIICNYKI